MFVDGNKKQQLVTNCCGKAITERETAQVTICRQKNMPLPGLEPGISGLAVLCLILLSYRGS